MTSLLDTPVSRTTFCVVDVETSGLSMSSRVVEIGAVRFTGDGGCKEFQCLVHPCEAIWPEATAIHGITDDMVRHSPRAPDVLPGLLNFMRDSVFVAHNATFDVRMLSNELTRNRMEVPDSPVVCTIRLARKQLPGPANYRLETLVDFLGVQPGRLHNALPDAHAARHVLMAALDGLPPELKVGEMPGMLGLFHEVAPATVQDFEPEGRLDELPELARSRLAIEMEYETSLHHGPVVVTPLYVFQGTEHDYLKAYCHRDGIPKTYRTDRILSFRRV